MGGGIHLIDLLLWFTSATVNTVYAVGNRIQTKNTKFKNDDLVVSTLTFNEGFTAQLVCNFGGVNPHYHQVEIFGTTGSFINNDVGGFYYHKRDPKNGNYNYLINKPEFENYSGRTEAKTEYKTLSKGDYIYDFVDAIVHDKENPITRKEIFDVLSVCLAIEDSLKNKRVVKVKYL